MTNDWILSVLTDLQAFAQSNDLDRLATHLGETKLLAAAELSQYADNPMGVAKGHDAEVGEYYRAVGQSSNA